MVKATKANVDKELRERIFADIMAYDPAQRTIDFFKVNDRQYGALLTDVNGDIRYVRVGAIVAELREDMTAEELMNSEIEAYQEKVAIKEEKAKAKAEKIARDKAKREAEAEAKAKEEQA